MVQAITLPITFHFNSAAFRNKVQQRAFMHKLLNPEKAALKLVD